MKVSHAEIERCRGDPVAWVRAKLKGGDGEGTFLRRGFQAALRDAICHYHRTSSVSGAHTALSGYLGKFTNAARKQETHDALDNYVYWHRSSGVIVAHSRVRLSYALGKDVFIGGEITRLDVDPGGGRYTAVLLSHAPTFNEAELRWPLIQLAIARQFARDPDLIDVGVQDLSGVPCVVRTYSPSELSAAEIAGAELASEIGQAIILVNGGAHE